MQLKFPEGKTSWEPPVSGSGPVQNLVCVQCAEGNCACCQLECVDLCKVSCFPSQSVRFCHLICCPVTVHTYTLAELCMRGAVLPLHGVHQISAFTCYCGLAVTNIFSACSSCFICPHQGLKCKLGGVAVLALCCFSPPLLNTVPNQVFKENVGHFELSQIVLSVSWNFYSLL